MLVFLERLGAVVLVVLAEEEIIIRRVGGGGAALIARRPGLQIGPAGRPVRLPQVLYSAAKRPVEERRGLPVMSRLT